MRMEVAAFFDANICVGLSDYPILNRCCDFVRPTPAVDAGDPVKSVLTSKANHQFTTCTPLWAFHLQPNCKPALIRDLKKQGVVAGKIYPEKGWNKTLLSQPGRDLLDSFSEMEKLKMVLCVHGELPGESPLEAESKFLNTVTYLCSNFPDLKIVWESVTTANVVGFIQARSGRSHQLAGSITPHHLCLILDDILGPHLRSRYYCRPVPKHARDRRALIDAVTGECPQFFLGSDSVPTDKVGGTSSMYSLPVMGATVFEVFDRSGRLNKIENFTSRNACRFYGVQSTGRKIAFCKDAWKVPSDYAGLVPFRAGETLAWQEAS